MENESGSLRNYRTVEEFVRTYLQRHPTAKYLHDDLLSEAYLMVAEGKRITEQTVYSRLREYSYKVANVTTRSTSRRHGIQPLQDLDVDNLPALENESWRDWWECCSNDTEWQVVRMMLSGHNKTATAQQLELTRDTVEQILQRVGQRYADSA